MEGGWLLSLPRVNPTIHGWAAPGAAPAPPPVLEIDARMTARMQAIRV